jgi:hypothetical protein
MSTDATVEAPAALTPDQLRQFDEDGLLLLPQFLGEDSRNDLAPAYARLKKDLDAGRGTLARNDRFVAGLIPAPVGTIYRHPKLVALARQMIGEDVALYMNRILLKDRQWSGAVATHQDMPYFHGTQAKLSVFVALTEHDPDNGGLRYYAGSHKYGNIGRGDILVDKWPPMTQIAPKMAVGDVLLMSFFTWHYSEAATRPRERALLQFAYQPSSDGSYTAGNLPEPTLVCGQWRTGHFVPLDYGISKF